MKKLLLVVFALIIASIATTTATTTTTATETAPPPKEGGILRVIRLEAPSASIGIPSKWKGMSQNCMQNRIIENLVTEGWHGELLPELATDWEWSNNNKTVTFTLRQGVKFHDGTDFNAEAVKKNYDIRVPSGLVGTELIESYEVVDDYTFRFNLTHYDNTWLPRLGQMLGAIISPTAYEEHGEEWLDWHPVGTGPFKFVEYKESESLTMERFDDYWAGRPKLDGIVDSFITDQVTAQLAFESGQADVIFLPNGGERLASQLAPLGYTVHEALYMTDALVPSGGQPDSILSNLKVREALEYAIDKADIAKTLGYGYWQPRYQCASALYSSFDPDFQGRVYDPEKAKQLLAELGYDETNPLTITFYCATNFKGDQLEAIQADWLACNIDATVKIISTGAWIDMEINGWDDGVLFGPQVTHYSMGDYIVHCYAQPAKPNWTRGVYFDALYRPPELEPLINEFVTLPFGDEYDAKGREIIQMIYDNAIIIPLWQSNWLHIEQHKVHDYRTDKRRFWTNVDKFWLE